MRFHYYKNCVAFTPEQVPALERMIQDAEKISYSQFVNSCDCRDLFQRLGYAHPNSGPNALTIRKDPTVSYYRSRLNGVLVYYLCWSAIEHVFVREKDMPIFKERVTLLHETPFDDAESGIAQDVAALQFAKMDVKTPVV